ncbi:MAG: hypothetical protein ACOVLC_08025 [Flavobacterium sp.]
MQLQLDLPYDGIVDYFVTSLDGRMIDDGEIVGSKAGKNTMDFNLETNSNSIVILTFVFDNKFYRSQKVVKK